VRRVVLSRCAQRGLLMYPFSNFRWWSCTPTPLGSTNDFGTHQDTKIQFFIHYSTKNIFTRCRKRMTLELLQKLQAATHSLPTADADLPSAA